MVDLAGQDEVGGVGSAGEWWRAAASAGRRAQGQLAEGRSPGRLGARATRARAVARPAPGGRHAGGGRPGNVLKREDAEGSTPCIS